MIIPIPLRKFLFLCLATLLLTQMSFVPGYALNVSNDIISQTDAGPALCLTELPSTSAYPEVEISFRMFDANFLPVNSVTDDQVRISENGNPSISLNKTLQTNPNHGGIDFYFVIDRSNRADQWEVYRMLQEFANYYQEGLDSVTIYTDTNNEAQQYYPSTNFNGLAKAISDYPRESEDNMRTIYAALDRLIAQFETTDICASPRMIYFILGDGTFNQANSGKFAEIAKLSHAKMALLHLRNPKNNSFGDEALYEGSIAGARGIYKQVLSPIEDAKTIFDQLAPYRQVYTASFRTNHGASGTHTLQAEYQGATITTGGQNSYTINLLPPKINLSTETVVTRSAVERVDGGFSYDRNAQDITVHVSWPDGYPRKLLSSATLIIGGQTAQEERIPISLAEAGANSYQFSWNFAVMQERGQHDISLSLEVTDEFGITAKPDTGLQITILNTVSPSIYLKGFSWLLYLMAGFIVVLLVAIVVMWRKLGNLAQMGGQVISKIAGEIRKTLVGGGRRGKPLAVLKILDGPASLIGQELKIFTERVSLGRDPKISDLTFYAPDTNSSISGLHAILERVNGSWRLVAVSQSRSETFVDNHAIPFDDPVYIKAGQQVRLGYPAQQPVLFEFQTQDSSRATETADPRRTDVGDKTTPIGLIKIEKDKEQKLKQDASEDKNSLFDEYLD